MQENFTVRNPEIEDKLRDIGKLIGDSLPKTHGFTLLIYRYEPGEMFYISNSVREDMIKAMKEFIEKNEKHE